MPVTSPCPKVETLQRLLLGQFSNEEADPLEQHLAQCSHCLQAAQQLKAEDTLIAAMHGARPDAATTLEDNAVKKLIDRLSGMAVPQAPPVAEATVANAPGTLHRPARPPRSCTIS
jgi:anti-sigma factor RsiW